MVHSSWLIAVLLLPCIAFAFDIPPNDGFVTDTAGVLSSAQEQQLEEELGAYRQETSNEIAILIVQSLGGEAAVDIAVEVGRDWGVGTAENDNGILMLMSYEDREIFIATGYGLEGAVPDLVAKGVIEQEILPRFRDGQYFEGLQAGIDALQKHIGGEYTAERYDQDFDVSALPWGVLLFIGFILFEVLGAFLGRSKSWWLGGIIGVVAGLVLSFLFAWWLSIPILALIGLFFDYLASRYYTPQHRRNARRRGGGFWTGGMGSGGGGGGFGGFSGGSFGGGGAGGRW